MGGTTPVYGIRYPDANTPARKLGDELSDMGRDLEAALKQAGGAGPVDTGWIAVTPGTGVAMMPVVRRQGSLVHARGVFQYAAGGTIGSSFVTVGKLPGGCAPAQQWPIGIGSSLPSVFQGMLLPDGSIQIRTFQPGGAAYTSSSSFSLVGSWLSS